MQHTYFCLQLSRSTSTPDSGWASNKWTDRLWSVSGWSRALWTADQPDIQLFLLISIWSWLKQYSPSRYSTTDLFLDDC